MIRFNNDYNKGAHPEVLNALIRHNDESYPGYGLDPWCEKAAGMIRDCIGRPDADVHFLPGGTVSNVTVIAAALRPYESVLAADTGHIHVHETGAVEHTGHKIELLKSKDGKISAQQIAEAADGFNESIVKEHITEPKMVYISFPTEYGTVYTKKELEDISSVCREKGIYLYIDGARMGYGVGAYDGTVSIEDIARLADVFYIGGTKCGTLFGEAVVICNDELKKSFRSSIKQNGAMTAKGWLIGLQFCALMENGLYFEITKKAVQQAIRLRNAFAEKGIPFYMVSPTNQQFVLLTEEQAEKLSEKYFYEFEFKTNTGYSCVRFCTSWATTDEEVDELIADIALLDD